MYLNEVKETENHYSIDNLSISINDYNTQQMNFAEPKPVSQTVTRRTLPSTSD